ncbi:response regulator [Methylocystis heyeri]|uniref:Response regulator n=2 Tax=Methylocystis heyeri TaxID=391905 RepID=A0A6B8KLS7_9HYPH|nr:response regulator [Methylocystis heyeri]QGM48181.1 response regulator [Methylocystis heyeri]
MQIGVETAKAVENKRIFVIDEDEIMRAAMQFMLHDENETHEAPSLDWAYAKAKDWPPDLAIVSEALVRVRGKELFGELRDRLSGCKILVIAESSADGFAKQCLEDGADGVLIKPLTIEFMRRKVDVLLGRR